MLVHTVPVALLFSRAYVEVERSTNLAPILNFEMLAEIVNHCVVRIERASLLWIRSVLHLLRATTVMPIETTILTVVDPVNKCANINHDRHLLL
jgi:hypothetical protein